MTNNKNNIINIAAALITFLVQMFISFWLSPYVVGKLGEEAYGFINLANNFVSYASLIAVAVNSMACRYISVEYNSERKGEAKAYFTSVFIVNVVLFSVIFILSLFFIGKINHFINVSDGLVNQVKLTFLFCFINMGLSFVGTVYTAAAFATNKMHYNSLIQIIANIVKSVLVFALFTILPAKIYYLGLATLAAGFLIFCGNYVITKKLLPGFDVNIAYFDLRKIKILTKSGFWVLVSNISNLLLNGLDLLLSNWFISSAIMGRLSLAKQIPFALSNALGSFSNIFSSALTKVLAIDGESRIIDEANGQLKILTILFTVPYAGIIIYGLDFMKLWLRNTSYSQNQLYEIYILMILVLLDIIISTYMYSVHSVFIAIDAVKVYSVVLFIASCISICLTIFLLKITNLGMYAVAGTSTIILGFTHGIIVPGSAAKLLKKPIWLFWKSEVKSWMVLIVICTVFKALSIILDFSSWLSFFISIIIAGILGYVISLFLVLNKLERKGCKKWIKNKFAK